MQFGCAVCWPSFPASCGCSSGTPNLKNKEQAPLCDRRDLLYLPIFLEKPLAISGGLVYYKDAGNIDCGQAAGCCSALRPCTSELGTQHSNLIFDCTTGLLYPFSALIARAEFGNDGRAFALIFSGGVELRNSTPLFMFLADIAPGRRYCLSFDFLPASLGGVCWDILFFEKGKGQ